MTTKNNIFSR